MNRIIIIIILLLHNGPEDYTLFRVCEFSRFLYPGIRARELCAASAKSVKEAEEGKDNTLSGALSVEAVAAHTAQTSGQVGLAGTASAIGVQSSIKESRRATNFFGPKGSQVSKNQQPAQPSPPSSPQVSEHLPRRLSVSASVAGDDGMYSCILPEDLLVEILAERMQVWLVWHY